MREWTHPKCVKLPTLLANLRWMAAPLLSEAAGACSPSAPKEATSHTCTLQTLADTHLPASVHCPMAVP